MSGVLRLIRREWTVTEPELTRVLEALEWYASQPNGERARATLDGLSVACGQEEYHRGYADGYHDARDEALNGR